MGNSRRLRRSQKVNGQAVIQFPDNRPGADQTEGQPGPGRINGYACTDCSKITMCVHVDAGVTPMFLHCQITEGCEGTAESMMYPDPPYPDRILNAVRYEWYRPDENEFKKLSPEMQEHVARGGLVLRERI